MTTANAHTTEARDAYAYASAIASESRHLIGGRMIEGTVPGTVRAPWDRTQMVEYRMADADTVRAAIHAARTAFEADTADLAARRALLGQMADHVEKIARELSLLISFETGKLFRSATMETAGTIAALQHWASVEPRAEELRSAAGKRVRVLRRPIGVVASITPFNMPLLMMVNKIGAALVTGNTVVCKPSPAAPLSAMRLARAFADLVPPGWVNIVAGDDAAGPVLSEHPDVAMISFTGSVAVGKRIMTAAASTLKRVQLELGGNDPAILGADADLDTVVPQIFRSAFASSGQACVAVKRVYVPRPIADDVVDRLASLAAQARTGNPFDAEATAPALTTEAQYDRVQSLLEGTRSRGGRVAYEGVRSKEPGFFMQPSIVTDLAPGDPIVDEEQFGPVLPVIAYDTEDDVIRLANGTLYGLGASVWSADDEFIERIVSRLEAGVVWVNELAMPDPSIPFGGVKQSGIGREGGDAGVDAFCELVTITDGTAVRSAVDAPDKAD
ncbi:aldehyde dehydrogenase family protein [Okibacterium endophyticum]